MDRKIGLVWHKSKECPKYEKWYDGEFRVSYYLERENL